MGKNGCWQRFIHFAVPLGLCFCVVLFYFLAHIGVFPTMGRVAHNHSEREDRARQVGLGERFCYRGLSAMIGLAMQIPLNLRVYDGPPCITIQARVRFNSGGS
jgi:hypothetical protein